MREPEQWIWLPPAAQTQGQETKYSALLPGDGNYAVAAFWRAYALGAPIKKLRLRFSGDAAFCLYLNGRLIARGPASAGGDFLDNETPRPNFYSFVLTEADGLELPADGRLRFTALVRRSPQRTFEYSAGCGGFMLTAHALDAEGILHVLLTDERWRCRLLPAFVEPGRYDGRRAPGEVFDAARIPNIRHTETAPIPPNEERLIFPVGGGTFTVAPGELLRRDLELDRIYAGYLRVFVRGAGETHLFVQFCETDELGTTERLVFNNGGAYTGFALHSAGRLRVTAEHCGRGGAAVTVALAAACQPTPFEAAFSCSDPALTRVLDVCAHTLRYCRQTLHLDSPRHCEPLACTGDYYVETCMTAARFGDLRLAAFDVRRTAELLRYHDGRMFHTSYSLIWVQMLWDVYLYTGDAALLPDCREALALLLERFDTYLGENGLLETPPDYMFVDWLAPDGIDLHHPPKALGQTCLNLFYYGALKTAEKIWDALALPGMANRCRARAAALADAIVRLLYDKEKGLFLAGLNTPTPERLLYHYMPQNTQKRYYLPHGGILAAYFGLFSPEENRALLIRMLETPGFCRVQPYFAHFLLEAVRRCGLRERYTLPLLERWKAPVAACGKGLAEGFYPPRENYAFDHSHAWGGTPLFALPMALSGMKILAPGMRELSLSPSLLGLERARFELPLNGEGKHITVILEKGARAVIIAPPDVRVQAPGDCILKTEEEKRA